MFSSLTGNKLFLNDIVSNIVLEHDYNSSQTKYRKNKEKQLKIN